MDGRLAEATGDQAGQPGSRCRRLVNDFQRGFPLSKRPFGDIAERLDWNETAVLEALAALSASGVVSRVGPVIRPNTVGVSALAAMAVPADRLAQVAGIVNRRHEVNHNYEREHRFNLWFVVAADNADALDETVRRIETDSGLPVMILPMLDDYYIDLGFDLDGSGSKPGPLNTGGECAAEIDDMDRLLLRAVQDGLPLVSRPYQSVGNIAGMTEGDVRARLGALVAKGVIKRFGVIVRHHECGYRHNAMVVWDVPDADVRAAGERLAGMDAVRLCYRRPRRPPDWPYNLFCMIHGCDRDAVNDEVERVSAAARLTGRPRDVLFSIRRFKQRGARYGCGPGPYRAEGEVA